MKVLDSKVLIQIIKESTKTDTGFILPENTNDYERAKVVAVGSEIAAKGILKEGDEVYIYLKCGKEIKVDGEWYRVITSNEIIVVL